MQLVYYLCSTLLVSGVVLLTPLSSLALHVVVAGVPQLVTVERLAVLRLVRAAILRIELPA